MERPHVKIVWVPGDPQKQPEEPEVMTLSAPRVERKNESMLLGGPSESNFLTMPEPCVCVCVCVRV